jgi:hypothetical protein
MFFLVVLGWPLAVLLVLSTYTGARDWMATEYPTRPPPAEPRVGVQYPGYRATTERALSSFGALPAAERAHLLAALRKHIRPAEVWLAELNDKGFEVLCLGEDHAEGTRDFVATQLLPHLQYRQLLLESTPSEIDRIRNKVASGREYFPLLGADIAGILRDAGRRNPPVEVAGIEESETQRQRRQQQPAAGTHRGRDDSIADNFRARYRPGERHLLLFGAFHCSTEPGWLLSTLRHRWQGPATSLLTLRVLEARSQGPVESMVNFLDAIGLGLSDFVVDDSARVPPEFASWFPILRQSILSRYDALLVFRDP